MIKTILTPIDGSTHAQSALELSTDLAMRYEADLVLLHVGSYYNVVPKEIFDAAAREVDESPSQEPESGDSSAQSRHARVLEAAGNLILREASARASAKGLGQVGTVFEFGDAGERILHLAKQRSADLIVMGSRGLGDLAGLVLGSVSHKVFHLAPCSCITVRQQGSKPSLEGIRNILVPTDGSESANKAVNLASDIAGTYGAKLTLLYIMWRGPSLEQLRSSIDPNALSQETREELEPTLHPVAEHLSGSFFPPVVPKSALTEIGQQVLDRGRKAAVAKGARIVDLELRESDDPARAIVALAEHIEADLITLGSRGLGGLEGLLTGSVSYKVNHSAPCSCMIVR